MGSQTLLDVLVECDQWQKRAKAAGEHLDQVMARVRELEREIARLQWQRRPTSTAAESVQRTLLYGAIPTTERDRR